LESIIDFKTAQMGMNSLTHLYMCMYGHPLPKKFLEGPPHGFALDKKVQLHFGQMFKFDTGNIKKEAGAWYSIYESRVLFKLATTSSISPPVIGFFVA